jgi:hypothetical protein
MPDEAYAVHRGHGVLMPVLECRAARDLAKPTRSQSISTCLQGSGDVIRDTNPGKQAMAGFYMNEKFGAWQVGDDPDQGAVQFKLLFPDRTKSPSQYEARPGQPTYGDPQIVAIRVVGDFMSALGLMNWDGGSAPAMTKTPHPKGTVWTYRTPVELPQGFYQYKYLVTFANGTTRDVPDPCTRYGGSSDQNSGFVIGGSSPSDNLVPPVAGGRKNPRDLVVYELNIDDFTDQYRGLKAPVAAVRDRLDYTRLFKA